VPRCFVEKNGSKILLMSAAPIPDPESRMEIAIRPAASRTDTSSRRDAAPDIASRALRTRLINA